MKHHPVRLSLELEGEESLAGRLVDERGQVWQFRGWMEFTEAVEAARVRRHTPAAAARDRISEVGQGTR